MVSPAAGNAQRHPGAAGVPGRDLLASLRDKMRRFTVVGLTGAELAALRGELAAFLAPLPAGCPDAVIAKSEFDAVTAEQDERAQARPAWREPGQ